MIPRNRCLVYRIAAFVIWRVFEKIERCAIVAEYKDLAETPVRFECPLLIGFNGTTQALELAASFKAFDVTIEVSKRECSAYRDIVPERYSSVAIAGIHYNCVSDKHRIVFQYCRDILSARGKTLNGSLATFNLTENCQCLHGGRVLAQVCFQLENVSKKINSGAALQRDVITDGESAPVHFELAHIVTFCAFNPANHQPEYCRLVKVPATQPQGGIGFLTSGLDIPVMQAPHDVLSESSKPSRRSLATAANGEACVSYVKWQFGARDGRFKAPSLCHLANFVFEFRTTA